jgi:CHASE1-domain containing sensor protein
MTIIFIGIAGSIALYFIAKRMETLQIKQNLYQESEKTFQEIKAALNQNLSVLEAIKIYYLSSVNITREEFKTYTGFFLKKSNNIMALEWAPLVQFNEKNDYELKMQQEEVLSLILDFSSPD